MPLILLVSKALQQMDGQGLLESRNLTRSSWKREHRKKNAKSRYRNETLVWVRVQTIYRLLEERLRRRRRISQGYWYALRISQTRRRSQYASGYLSPCSTVCPAIARYCSRIQKAHTLDFSLVSDADTSTTLFLLIWIYSMVDTKYMCASAAELRVSAASVYAQFAIFQNFQLSSRSLVRPRRSISCALKPTVRYSKTRVSVWCNGLNYSKLLHGLASLSSPSVLVLSPTSISIRYAHGIPSIFKW